MDAFIARYEWKQRHSLKVGLETCDKKTSIHQTQYNAVTLSLLLSHEHTGYSGVNRAMLRTQVKGDGPIYTPYTLQLNQAKPPLIPQNYIIDRQSRDRIT